MRISDWSSDVCSSDLATSRGVAGRLTLGLYTSLSTGRLRDALAAYTDRHPEVELHVVEGDQSRMVEGISSRSIDIVVLLGAPDEMLGEPLLLWRESRQIGRASCRERVCQYE